MTNPSIRSASAKRKPDTLLVPVFWPRDGVTTLAKLWGKKVGPFFVHYDFVDGVDFRSVVQNREQPIVVTHWPTARRLVGNFDTTADAMQFVREISGLIDWRQVKKPLDDPKFAKRVYDIADRVRGYQG